MNNSKGPTRKCGTRGRWVKKGYATVPNHIFRDSLTVKENNLTATVNQKAGYKSIKGSMRARTRSHTNNTQ